MTLRSFLDAAYAIQVREANRMGMSLLDALDRFQAGAATNVHRKSKRTAEERAVERQNARALANLERMMMGARSRG